MRQSIKTYYYLIVLTASLLLNCVACLGQDNLHPKIAFLADIHLQDVYAELDSENFKGVWNPKSEKYATIRTMQSQLNSTRLFNENYFALISALEDLNKLGISLVALPGDFTDDGQPMNVLAIKNILDHYSEKYNMRFFLTTGNHDPVVPFGGIAGKRDFLGEKGNKQMLAGDPELYQEEDQAITSQINYWGYYEICEELSDFGFYPSSDDIFWTHPFMYLDYDSYDYEFAKSQADMDNRLFEIGKSGEFLPDASYLVEPVNGLWLLALDGNAYNAIGKNDDHDSLKWSGSSIGFNESSIQKEHQLEWIKQISKEAKSRGKVLISFSHYPLVDFHDGASAQIAELFGKNKFQLNRVPTIEVSERYAEAGISIHFGGHMHINDTGIHPAKSGKNLYNIQVPSLAAFPSAYKILTCLPGNKFEVHTRQIVEVDRMDEFFDLYRMEHAYLLKNSPKGIWDQEILESDNFQEFTLHHLKELIRLRLIPGDWPEGLAKLLEDISEKDLIFWATLNESEGYDFLTLSKNDSLDKMEANFHTDFAGSLFSKINHDQNFIIEDFYLIKNGDDLGKKLIPTGRLDYYQELIRLTSLKTMGETDDLQSQLQQLISIFGKLLHSYPSNNFLINLEHQTIERID